MSVVRVDHVYKDYLLGEQRVPALKDITLAIEPGVFLAIAGPSGSGKTTLLNLIGCIDTPTSGKIYINDQDVSGNTPNEPPTCAHGRSASSSDVQPAARADGRRERRVPAAAAAGHRQVGPQETCRPFPGHRRTDAE
jgi:ABC-type oligopeptide transport system ATPase subunit